MMDEEYKCGRGDKKLMLKLMLWDAATFIFNAVLAISFFYLVYFLASDIL